VSSNKLRNFARASPISYYTLLHMAWLGLQSSIGFVPTTPKRQVWNKSDRIITWGGPFEETFPRNRKRFMPTLDMKEVFTDATSCVELQEFSKTSDDSAVEYVV